MLFCDKNYTHFLGIYELQSESIRLWTRRTLRNVFFKLF